MGRESEAIVSDLTETRRQAIVKAKRLVELLEKPDLTLVWADAMGMALAEVNLSIAAFARTLDARLADVKER